MTDEELAKKAQSLLEKIRSISDGPALTEKTADTKENGHIQPVYGLSQNIREHVEQMLRNRDNGVYTVDGGPDSGQTVDVAVVQGFYGTDPKRISATIRAMEINLRSNPFPAEWIFVESQTSRSKACFAWLADHGVKYIFEKTPKESVGLFLKQALWNIGARRSESDKLCFLDSDIAFCSPAWPASVTDALESYDVISPHGWSYYAENKTKFGMSESVGHKILTSGNTSCEGHIGFGICMKRHVFETLGGFDCFVPHNDNWLWTKIFGSEFKADNPGWTPYPPTDDMKYGLPVEIGSTEEVCFHIDHGGADFRIYEAAGWISRLAVDYPGQEHVYDFKTLELPVWSDTDEARTLRNSYRKLYSNKYNDDTGKDLYFEQAEKIYGKIDDEHPLFIVTSFIPSYKYKNEQCVFEFLEKIKSICSVPFTFLCISDENIDGIDTIKFTKKSLKNQNLAYIELFNQNLNFPKNSQILYLNLDNNLKINIQNIIICKNFISIGKNIIFFNGKFQNLYTKPAKLTSNNIKKYLNII